MKIFRLKELSLILLILSGVIALNDEQPKLRHDKKKVLAKTIDTLKKNQDHEMSVLRQDIAQFKKDMMERCGHVVRHAGIEEKNSKKLTLTWARKAVHALRVEMKEASKNVNISKISQQLHNLHTHVKRVTSENADLAILSRTLGARLDKLDDVVERLTYDNKNMELMLQEYKEQLDAIAKEVKTKIEAQEEAVNDFSEMGVVRTVTGPLFPEKNHKYRHDKMIYAQLSRLAQNQDKMDASQQNVKTKLGEYQRRLNRLEQPNWNAITAKINLLELQSKIFIERLNNNTLALSDINKIHASMLELRENLEGLENKIDKTIPDFRKEISKLDVNQAQNTAHFSYIKEDQENLRQSVKAIAVSMSNTQDRVEKESEDLKKINNTVIGLTTQTKKHFYRLNDHILKSEVNNDKVADPKLNELISLPELMSEVKELQPVEREYQDLVAQLPKDCSSIAGPAGSYLIRPGPSTVDAWCVNGTTLVQRRYNGSVEFNRKFTEYVHGFGDPTSEFWLGLETLHQLTKDNCSAMRIDMTDIYGAAWYAHYDTFYVGSADNGYVLSVYGFNGNASDAFEYQNHMEFSAIDRDRDISNTHCAANYEGGWWFANCQHVNINGKYTLGLTWFNSGNNEWIAVATTQMQVYRRPGCF